MASLEIHRWTRPARRRPAGVAAVALVAASLVACGGGSDDAGPGEGGDGGGGTEEVTLVLDWTPNTNHAGIYLAEARGWYDDAGIDLTVVQPGEGGALQALAGGRAEFAIAPQEEVVPARAEGIPVVAVAAVVEHNTSSLLSLADDAVARPADLEGKRYGGYGGNLEGALVDALVACDGGDPSAVDRVEVGNADFRVGLEEDFYDSVWVYEGWDRIRLAEIDGLAVDTIAFADHTDCIPDWYTPMLATSERQISEHADEVDRFVDVTARGYRAAMADPEAAADALLEAAPELDAELVRRSAAYLSTRYASDPEAWGRQDTAVWDRFVAFLVEAGLIDEPIDVAPAFTNRFLDEGSSG